MKKTYIWMILLVLLLTACGGEEVQPPANESDPVNTVAIPNPTASPEPTATLAVSGAQVTPLVEMPQAKPFDGSALPTDKGDYFAASGTCSVCHTKHEAADGSNVSIDTFWRGTMMANAARDPYWQASVRAETLAHPELDAIIQDTCATCHTPMARTTHKFNGEDGFLLDEGFLNPENELHNLGIDGTSCTLCHQIEADNFGEHESYDGGYVIDASLPSGERLNHGPYEVKEKFVTIMQSTSGYIPQRGSHIQSSEMCATCHTLYTPIIDLAGDVVGQFPEQMPYMEWLASDYAEKQSCQDCHMPETSGEIVLSVTGGPKRSPFSQHSFVGGNSYSLSLLRHFGEQMNVTASSAQIDAALQRANTQLQEQTAQVRITNLEIMDSILKTKVSISHQVGHKLPSGYPSRRVWIHLTVYDPQKNVIFDSGNWAADGSIVGNDNDLDEGRFEPHYEVIENPDQVQIYEAIMGNVDGEVTTTLLSGYQYTKDNRLLPLGFEKNNVEQDIAVIGFAVEDPEFLGGGDVIEYQITLGEVQGPLTVTVELLYQTIGYRWAQNLARYDASEPERFLSFYDDLPNIPVLIDSDLAEVEE